MAETRSSEEMNNSATDELLSQFKVLITCWYSLLAWVFVREDETGVDVDADAGVMHGVLQVVSFDNLEDQELEKREVPEGMYCFRCWLYR